jgi:hypothetical protein
LRSMLTCASVCAVLAAAAGQMADASVAAVTAGETVGAWCGAGPAVDRQPDAVAGRQIHVVYAVPSDGVDRYATIAPAIATDVAAMDGWWRTQDPTRAPRLDLAALPGCGSGLEALDISFVRLDGPTALYHPYAGRFQRLRFDLARTFLNPAKKYLVYYDAPVEAVNVCGTADLGGSVGPSYAAVYVGVPRCGTVGADDYNAKASVHELLHTLGAVPLEAPHPCPGNQAHTCDDGFDVMHGASYGFGGLSSWKLDAGNDDYYNHAGAWWDVRDSAWLRRLDAPQHRLAVTLAGMPGGSVTASTPGLDCPLICANVWDQGEKVTLSASAGLDARVARWTGCTGAGDTCEVTMDRARDVSVVFGRSTTPSASR